MFLPPFVGPRQLLQRCEQKIAVLEKIQNEIAERLEISIGVTEEDPFNRYIVLFSENASPESSFVIREAVNDLAVCLDITFCDIVRTKGKGTDRIKFPFAKTAGQLKKLLKFMDVDEDFDNFVRDMHPLYVPGNAWLVALHNLDVLMKHRMVVPLVGAIPTFLPNMLSASGIQISDQERAWFASQVGFDFLQIPMMVKHGYQYMMRPDIDPFSAVGSAKDVILILPEDVPLGGMNVVSILRQIQQAILEFVALSETRYTPPKEDSREESSGHASDDP